jgi:phage I-like protein
LVHWAITNAPYIKGLAPYEAVALGEDGDGATIISLNDEKGGSMDPIQQALEALKDASDEDIRKALAEHRPEVLKAEEGGEGAPDLDAVKTEAKEEATKELVAALAERGVVVEFSEKEAGSETGKIDVSKSPEFVELSEKFDTMAKERAEEKATAVIDEAIKDGKILPAQKEGLLEVALSEGGMERLKKLIPTEAIVELGERGVSTTKETSVELSEEDADKEADRYLALVGGKKED